MSATRLPTGGSPAVVAAPRPATGAAYFERMWAGTDDPWDHTGAWREERRFRLTVAALPQRYYRRGFEPGCGTGMLTILLAERVDQLLSVDRHPRATEVTRRRVGSRANVHVATATIPDDWPEGPFDLVVLSEVLYYLDDAGLDATLAGAARVLEPGGHLLVAHHRRAVAEHARSGDEVHERVRARAGFTSLSQVVEPGLVLDVLERTALVDLTATGPGGRPSG